MKSKETMEGKKAEFFFCVMFIYNILSYNKLFKIRKKKI